MGLPAAVPLQCALREKCDKVNCLWKDGRLIHTDEAVVSHLILVHTRLLEIEEEMVGESHLEHPEI